MTRATAAAVRRHIAEVQLVYLAAVTKPSGRSLRAFPMPRSTIRLVWALNLALVGSSSGCTNDASFQEPSGGSPTESTCPSDTELTYELFGRAFMESYCTRCHDSSLTGTARQNAPIDHDFNTLQGVLEVAEHIDEFAAAGPAATNTAMPPNGPTPSEAERKRLGEWLACEVADGSGGDGGDQH